MQTLLILILLGMSLFYRTCSQEYRRQLKRCLNAMADANNRIWNMEDYKDRDDWKNQGMKRASESLEDQMTAVDLLLK